MNLKNISTELKEKEAFYQAMEAFKVHFEETSPNRVQVLRKEVERVAKRKSKEIIQYRSGLEFGGELIEEMAQAGIDSTLAFSPISWAMAGISSGIGCLMLAINLGLRVHFAIRGRGAETAKRLAAGYEQAPLRQEFINHKKNEDQDREVFKAFN